MATHRRSRKLDDIDLVVIHCSDTPNGRWHGVGDIDDWHRERGFSRAPHFRDRQNPRVTAVGYHFVIYTNGAIATGRHLQEIGAHVLRHNARSVGVCLIGRDAYSPAAWRMLAANIRGLQHQFPNARVVGHTDLDDSKTCPGFDVSAWLDNHMTPPPGHVLGDGDFDRGPSAN